ncbi:MAG TPA: c-type cytochrome [Bacteroidia bacterium]|nr:c-type cytochrome [Bacteroidia bacterium]
MKTVSRILLMSAGSLLMLSAYIPWVAPKEADELANPYKDNAAETVAGKKLYTTYCVVCHGEKGKGDGPAGISLMPRPADHSSMKVQSQTDGAIFWKITNGRAPMASYKNFTEEQRWQLVNYIRVLGQAPVKKK